MHSHASAAELAKAMADAGIVDIAALAALLDAPERTVRRWTTLGCARYVITLLELYTLNRALRIEVRRLSMIVDHYQRQKR